MLSSPSAATATARALKGLPEQSCTRTGSWDSLGVFRSSHKASTQKAEFALCLQTASLLAQPLSYCPLLPSPTPFLLLLFLLAEMTLSLSLSFFFLWLTSLLPVLSRGLFVKLIMHR